VIITKNDVDCVDDDDDDDDGWYWLCVAVDDGRWFLIWR